MRRALRALALMVLLTLVVVSPLSAGAISSEVVVPVAGYLVRGELVYRTELMISNHRDVAQGVTIEFVSGGFSGMIRGFTLGPRETKFFPDGAMATGGTRATNVGAMRIVASMPYTGDTDAPLPDPAGKLEVKSFIVAERGRFAVNGTSRQEVEAIPQEEYHAEEAVFLGVRHDLPTYTNVGIVNLHPTQSETFYIEFQYLDPMPLIVPPLSHRQVRIPGPGNGGRMVRVYPEWAVGDGAPARTTPWVAYASTVDGYTGAAHSGLRAPVDTEVRP